jgi:hypothetical protein
LLQQAELTTSRGLPWHIRGRDEEDFFVERPKVPGEAYGIQVLGDDFYATKRGDAEFIVLAKRIASEP